MRFLVKGRNRERGWRNLRRNRVGPERFQLKSFMGGHVL